jgi:DNA-binding MarR family transcriptional regulator
MTSSPSKAESLRRIERELGVLLHRVRRRTTQSAAAVHPDLQPAALPVLLFVADNRGAHASDVVEHFGIDKGAVSRHVVHLEQLGLLARSCDPEDRRAQTLVLTDDAVERIRAARAERRRDVAGRLADWSPEELAALADQLRRYNASLEA